MIATVLLAILLSLTTISLAAECPHEKAFRDSGWIVHDSGKFHQILHEKRCECLSHSGGDFVLDGAESYISHYSYNSYLIMWIVILDRVSTLKDEMWGDVAFASTSPYEEEYIEIRWYDPITRTRHIVCNPDHVYCLTTKVPLAYNTIF